MPHRDDVAAADEQVRLAEPDAPVQHLRRARDNEQRVAVAFELGPLVRAAGVLDREVVEAELRLNPTQQRVPRLQQPDPDDVAGLVQPATRRPAA